jgi:ABC-2 type transport system permease protein
MRPEIALQTLRDRRALTAALAGYLVLLVGVMTIFWPAVRDSADLQSFVRDLPAGVKALIGDADYATAAGFLSAELFSLMVPLLMLVAAIGLGARAIAGEEEAGTIDLLLSLPITRRRVLVEKMAAAALDTIVLGLALFVSLVLASVLAGLHLDTAHVAAAAAASVLIAWPFGALALLVGCATGRRSAAIAAAVAVAVIAYLLHALAPLVDALDGWDVLSPFAWYAGDVVLSEGLTVGHVIAPIAVADALCAAAVVVLERRDLAAA